MSRDLCLRGALGGVWYGSLRGDWVKEDDAVRMTLASFAHFNSSNRESSACEMCQCARAQLGTVALFYQLRQLGINES